MAYWLPKPQFDEFNFFNCGKKPPGQVTLDLDQLPAGLHSAYLFGHEKKPRNLIKKNVATFNGTAWRLGMMNGEPMILWDRTDSNEVDLNDAGTAWEFHTSATMSYSIFHQFAFDTASGAAELSLSGNWDGIVDADIYPFTDTTPQDLQTHRVMLTRTDTGRTRFFIDGRKIGDDATQFGNTGGCHIIRYDNIQNGGQWEIFTGEAVSTDIFIGGVPYKTADRVSGGSSITMMWQRELSEGAARALTRDINPYLIPV